MMLDTMKILIFYENHYYGINILNILHIIYEYIKKFLTVKRHHKNISFQTLCFEPPPPIPSKLSVCLKNYYHGCYAS